jgi:Glycosyltransferase family 87
VRAVITIGGGTMNGESLSPHTRPLPRDLLLFGQLPALVVGLAGWTVARAPGFDYRIFRGAGVEVVHGRTPFVAPALAGSGHHFVYPQPVAYLFAPLALVGPRAGAVALFAVSLAAIMAGLRLLGVQDWRVYGAALAGAPAVEALLLGAVGPLLFLLAAAGWRWRRHAWVGVLLAAAAAAKVFLWPLLVWLLLTRRWRASAAAAATIAAMAAVWLAADPAGLRSYPRTLRALEAGEPSTFSPRGLALALGAPSLLADLLPFLVAAAGVLVLVAIRRDERAGFAAGIVVALLASPIVWPHYLVLLLVPLALYRPRLDAAWAIPVLLWIAPQTMPHGSAWRIALLVGAVVATAAATIRPYHRPAGTPVVRLSSARTP